MNPRFSDRSDALPVSSPLPAEGRSPRFSGWVLGGLGAIAALALYGLVLLIPMPEVVLRLLPTSRPWVPLVFSGLLWLSLRQTHRLEPSLSLGTILLLFAMPLVLLWNTGASNLGALGGLVPWTDSRIYFHIAHGLLDGSEVNMGYARPFFPGLLTVIFALTQRNLMQTQVILTAITAIAIHLATRELRRTHGAWLAAFCIIGVYVFYAPYIGSLMTENLGIALGVLSIAVLWRGASQRHERTVLVGIFLLTLALCSRMGALIALPLLLLWGGFEFRRSRRFSFAFLMMGSALILLGFVLNSLLTRLLSSQDYTSFGNYSFVLYGLLKGGNWQSIFHDHAADLQGSTSERVRIAYQICLTIIRQNPLALVKGMLRALVTLPIEGSALLVPQFVPQPLYGWLVNGIARPSLVLGLLVSLRHWRRPLAGLMLALVLGTLASAPLAPVWDAGLRPYGVTLIVYYMLMALGIRAVWQWIGQPSRNLQSLTMVWQPDALPNVPAPSGLWPEWMGRMARAGLSAPAVMALALSGIFFLGPLGIKAIATPPYLPDGHCPANTQPQKVYIHPQSAIHLITLDDAPRTRVPYVLTHDFQQRLKRLKVQPGLIQALRTIQPHHTLMQSQETGFLVLPTKMMPDDSGHYRVCGNYQEFAVNKLVKSSFFHVQSVLPSPSSP